MNTDRMLRMLSRIDTEMSGSRRRHVVVNCTRIVRLEINRYNRKNQKKNGQLFDQD